MRSRGAWSRIVGGLTLLFMMLASAFVAPAATAQTDEGSIEVHNRICPTEYAGSDFFEDCHDNPPDPGLTFTFTNGVTREGETNAEGDIGFANLPEGTYTITGGAPGEFAERYVYCAVGTAETSNQEPVEFEYVTGGIQFLLPADTNVICDWYDIPLDLQGEPEPTATPEFDDFDLPIYKLVCDVAPEDHAVSEFLTVGTVPTGCEQYAGTEVTVVDADGNAIGSCVTEAAAPCYVDVTVGTTVYGTEDLATVPEGYAPIEDETIELEIPPASEASLLFINVATEQEPDTFDLPIYKLLCDDDPGGQAGNGFVMEGTVPEGCEQLEGVPVTVTDVNGAEIGSCVTAALEPCYVAVEVGSTVNATEDLTAVPEGYAPLDGETIEYTIEPATEAWILFINVEVDPTPTAVPLTPTPEPTTEPLPPGRALQVVEGSCETDDLGEVVIDLEDLRSPTDGDEVGQDDVVVSETSATTVPLTLDVLFVNDHAIVAFSEDDTGINVTPVACTEIGGTINDSGELVIGLREQNDSDFTGTAYLAESDDDAAATDVSVFLAEGLAEDELESTPDP